MKSTHSFPSAYQTNMTQSYKYLDKVSDPVQNLYGSTFGRMSERKTNSQRPSNLRSESAIAKKKIESISRPMAQMNREDKDKLIATLQETIKKNENQITQLINKEMHYQDKLKGLEQIDNEQQKYLEAYEVVKEDQLCHLISNRENKLIKYQCFISWQRQVLQNKRSQIAELVQAKKELYESNIEQEQLIQQLQETNYIQQEQLNELQTLCQRSNHNEQQLNKENQDSQIIIEQQQQQIDELKRYVKDLEMNESQLTNRLGDLKKDITFYEQRIQSDDLRYSQQISHIVFQLQKKQKLYKVMFKWQNSIYKKHILQLREQDVQIQEIYNDNKDKIFKIKDLNEHNQILKNICDETHYNEQKLIIQNSDLLSQIDQMSQHIKYTQDYDILLDQYEIAKSQNKSLLAELTRVEALLSQSLRKTYEGHKFDRNLTHEYELTLREQQAHYQKLCQSRRRDH